MFLGTMLKLTIAAALVTLVGCDSEPSSARSPVDESAAPASNPYAFQSDRATNPIHGLTAELRPAGLEVSHVRDVRLFIQLSRFGRAESLEPVSAAPPIAEGHLATWRYENGLIEWWANHAGGLEQGFEVMTRPPGEGPVVLEIAVSGARVEESPRGLMFVDDARQTALSYEHLEVLDAAGRALPATFEVVEGGFQIQVDDANGTYPIRVDPILGSYSYYFFFILEETGPPSFGRSPNLVENIALMGAPRAAGGAGRVFFYRRFGDDWALAQQVRGEPEDRGFGRAALLDDNTETLFVGTGGPEGVLYVLARDDRELYSVTQRIELSREGRPSGGVAALSRVGSALLVGLPRDVPCDATSAMAPPPVEEEEEDLAEDGAAPEDEGGRGMRTGSVRVFEPTEPYGPYAEVACLAPDGAKAFGRSLERGGWVGAVDHAFFIRRVDGEWAIDLEATIAGEPGACFGRAVADLGFGHVAVGAPSMDEGRGEVRIFRMAGTGYEPIRTIRAPDGAPGDGFGATMAIGHTQVPTLFVGEPGRDVDGVPDAGRVHVFHAYPSYWGISVPHSGTIVAQVPRAEERFGRSMGAGSLEAQVELPKENPWDWVRHYRTGMSVVIQGKNRVELHDVDQILTYPHP